MLYYGPILIVSDALKMDRQMDRHQAAANATSMKKHAYVGTVYRITHFTSSWSLNLKGEVSSKMTNSFHWPDRISIFLEKFL